MGGNKGMGECLGLGSSEGKKESGRVVGKERGEQRGVKKERCR